MSWQLAMIGAGATITAIAAGIVMTTQQNKNPSQKPQPKPALSLRYFKPSEFRGWYERYSADTLTKLDEFRHRLGFSVAISPAPGALGRTGRQYRSSQHHYEEGKLVRGIDVMPNWPNGGTATELQRAYKIALEVGFTGVGVAPDWQPRAGLHLDTRTSRTTDNPAQWGYRKIDGQQRADISAQQAIINASHRHA